MIFISMSQSVPNWFSLTEWPKVNYKTKPRTRAWNTVSSSKWGHLVHSFPVPANWSPCGMALVTTTIKSRACKEDYQALDSEHSFNKNWPTSFNEKDECNIFLSSHTDFVRIHYSHQQMTLWKTAALLRAQSFQRASSSLSGTSQPRWLK